MYKFILSLIAFFLFSYSILGQFRSNLSEFNPAMTGLLDKQFGQVRYDYFKSSEFIKSSGLNGLYNYAADKVNSGFGIRFNRTETAFLINSGVGGSYQYTFNLGENFRLSTGTSLYYSQSKIKDEYIDIFSSEKRDFLKLNFGTALSWKNLNAGVSVGNFELINNDNTNQESTDNLRFNTHIWYDFNIGSDFILSPYWIMSTNHNNYIHQLNLRGEHFQRLWWNLSWSTNEQINIGAGIRVFNQLHLGYNIGISYSKNHSDLMFFHSGTITYRLQN